MLGKTLQFRILSRHCSNSINVFKRSISSSFEGSVDKDNEYDIIIAGGGMVGCTLACALAKNTKLSSQKILLLEGSPEKKYALPKEYSNRVSALNLNTKRLMEQLGAWKHIQDMRLQPVKNMQVWDASSDAVITFNKNNFEDDLAYIVENDVLLHAVNQELLSTDTSKQVKVVHSAKIADYTLPQTGGKKSIIQMENGDSYSCKLLLGADGANSKVREKMGVDYLSWKYDQMGVVATIQLPEDMENSTAWQRFLPTGPVALLPLDSRHSSLVWSTSPQEARRLLQLTPEEFIDALTHALHKDFPRFIVVDSVMNLLGAVIGGSKGLRQLPPPLTAVSGRAAFPLGFGHASRYVAHGVALVGDSAHRVHPLAGQGVNLGFGDICDLVHILANAVYRGAPLGEKSQLLQYETLRQRHVFPTALAIDGLHKLYTNTNTLSVLMRSVGLQMTNSLKPVKNALMGHAIG